jgi:hypothetical protein
LRPQAFHSSHVPWLARENRLFQPFYPLVLKRKSWRACTEQCGRLDLSHLSRVASLCVILRILQTSPPLMPPFCTVAKPRPEYLQQCRGQYGDVSPHLCSIPRFLYSCCLSLSYSSYSSIEGGCPGCWKWKSASTGDGLYTLSAYLPSRKTVSPIAVRVPKPRLKTMLRLVRKPVV